MSKQQSVKKTDSAPTSTPKSDTPKSAKAPKTAKVASESVAVTISAPAAAPVAVAAPTPKKSAKKSAAVAAPVVAAVDVSVPEVVSADAVVAVDGQALTSDYSVFMTKLQQVSTLLSTLKAEFRQLERKATRELKTATKANAKRNKRKNGNRSPSGFVKPTLISAELATFLGKPAGSEMARTEVTREINNYIRTNSLQDKTNGRKINADAKLMALLKVAPTDELTYFNLQRFMSPHFFKATASTTNVVVA
jgi:hypothetical protein